MRRLLIIGSILVGGVIVACVGAAWFLLGTSAGRARLADAAETQIAAAVGGEATIGEIRSGLPGRITIDNVTLTDDDVWLRVGRIRLIWRPAALLRGALVVEEATLEDAAFLAQPPRSPNPQPRDAAPKPIRIPDTLPTVDVRSVTVTGFSFGEQILGAPVTIDAAGMLRTGGRDIEVRFKVDARETRDSARIAIRRDPLTDELSAEIDLDSAADGALASMLNAEGPVSIEAAGDGPVTAFALSFAARVGEIADVDGRLSADFEAMDEISLGALARFGPASADIADLIGDTLDVALRVAPSDDALALYIDNAVAPAGALSGTLTLANDDDALRAIGVDAELSISPDAPPTVADIGAFLGRNIALSGEAARDADEYNLNASIAADMMALAVVDGRSDLTRRIAGVLSLEGAPNARLPSIAADGFSAKATFDAVADGLSTIESVRIDTPTGARFDGAARYDAQSDELNLAGEATASERLIRTLLGAETDGSARATVDVAGAIDRFAVEIDGSTPVLSINEQPIPAFSFAGAVSGLPTAPDGRITVSEIDGARRLLASLRAPSPDVYEISSLAMTGNDFSLGASGRWEAGVGRFEAQYDGGPNAEPWPGLPVVGAVTAKGSRGANGAVSVAVAAPRFRAQDAVVRAFELEAAGPAEDIAIALSLAQAAIGGAELRDAALEARAVFDDDAAPALLLEALSIVANDIDVRTRGPARFVFDDGLAVEDLALAIGEQGRLDADGAFTAERWRLALDLQDAPAGTADARIDAGVSLDTDAALPAEGAATLTPIGVDAAAAPIRIAFDWDGETARLRDACDDARFTLNAALPLALQRSDGVSVAVGDTIDAALRYSGALEQLVLIAPEPARGLEGDLTIEASVAGALDAPTVNASARIVDGAYTELSSGLSVVDLNAQANADLSNGLGSLAFEAEARGPDQTASTIFANGEVDLGETIVVDGALRLDGAEFSATMVSSVVASGDIALTGAVDPAAPDDSDLRLAGAVEIQQLNVDLAPSEAGVDLTPVTLVGFDEAGLEDPLSLTPPSAPEDPAGSDAGPDVALDITIAAPRRLFVRGLGLETEWSADLRVIGTASAPVVVGGINSRRGSLDFAGRRFDIVEGALAFDRLRVNDPAVDLRAEYETANEVLAAIEVGGRAFAPTVNLESTPSLPREDIMAIVLFGKPANQLTAFESLQVAQALANLGGLGPFGGGGPGLSGRARESLGLDLLNVDLDSDAGASALTAGKYVTDGLFVSASQNARGDEGAVRVQYEVTNNIVVETELQQNGDQTVSANWKRDF